MEEWFVFLLWSLSGHLASLFFSHSNPVWARNDIFPFLFFLKVYKLTSPKQTIPGMAQLSSHKTFASRKHYLVTWPPIYTTRNTCITCRRGDNSCHWHLYNFLNCYRDWVFTQSRTQPVLVKNVYTIKTSMVEWAVVSNLRNETMN